MIATVNYQYRIYSHETTLSLSDAALIHLDRQAVIVNLTVTIKRIHILFRFLLKTVVRAIDNLSSAGTVTYGILFSGKQKL